MSNENNKVIIRIIQDYCFNNSAVYLISKYSLSITPLIEKHLDLKVLDIKELNKITKIRDDFYKINDIDPLSFNKGLLQKLNHEFQFYQSETFYDSIVNFKRKMENGPSRAFKKKESSEDILRSTLELYIKEETFCEARTSSGNSDIIIPSEKVIIETKIWNGLEYYNSGIPELYDYLEKKNYNAGYYIIFDNSQIKNCIIKEKGEIFDIDLKNRKIHVFFIMMNNICPSKIYKANKELTTYSKISNPQRNTTIGVV